MTKQPYGLIPIVTNCKHAGLSDNIPQISTIEAIGQLGIR